MTATCARPVVLAALLAGCSDQLPIIPAADYRVADSALGADSGVADAAAGDAQPHDAGAPDVAAGVCRFDAECGDEAFCRFESGCGADGPGTCTVRPNICNRDLVWVCGCDGNSYTNACQAYAARVSVWGLGECGCEALLGVYEAAVAVAKRCDPRTERLHCQFTVSEDLLCGCPTSVEDSPEALEALETRLRGMYDDMVGCAVPDCAGCLPNRLGATCERSGSDAGDGVCVDRYAWE
jgi:hypothetical protein